MKEPRCPKYKKCLRKKAPHDNNRSNRPSPKHESFLTSHDSISYLFYQQFNTDFYMVNFKRNYLPFPKQIYSREPLVNNCIQI